MTVSAEDFELVRRIVHDDAAIVLAQGKEYLVESRLSALARVRGRTGVTDLVGELRRDLDGELRTLVVEAMTTNETSFFRDNHPFDALEREIIPGLLAARAPERRINVWSAACSSGQEAYSVAMLLDQALEGRPGWGASILATDISAQMLERTREGVYTQLEVNRGLPVGRLMQHFTREGTHWRVGGHLGRMVQTRHLNLAADWPTLPGMDVILMRNVLIYFDTATKKRILAKVRSVLNPGGFLLLGGAETTLNLDDAYQRSQIGRTIVYTTGEGGGTP